MSESPARTGTGPAPPPRVLTLETDGTGSPLASGLIAAGCIVDTVSRPIDLRETLERASYDAVVLDLDASGLAQEVIAAAGEALRASGDGPDQERPVILAVWPAARLDGERARLRADVILATRDVERLVHEVEGTVAVRRVRRAQLEIEQLRNAVLFARHTAHELAQPLTTILARAQLLRNMMKPADPHMRAVEIICDEADRLARMVEEFQKLKVMSGQQAPRKS